MATLRSVAIEVVSELAVTATGPAAMIIGAVTPLESLVRLGQGGNLRNSNQVGAAESASFALDGALIVDALDAEEAVETSNPKWLRNVTNRSDSAEEHP